MARKDKSLNQQAVGNDVEEMKTKPEKTKHSSKSDLDGKKKKIKNLDSCEPETVSEANVVKSTDLGEKSVKNGEKLLPGDINNFRVSKEIKDVLAKKGIRSLFPIQEKTFDAIYDGKHVIGRARTGTGKTLAFALPSVESLLSTGELKKKGCRLLALLPTRELAQQVASEFDILSSGGKLFSTAIVVGGLPEDPQLRAVQQGAQVIIATPGRILDFLQRKAVDLGKLKILVLDEADQMLEMGFKDDVDSVLEYVEEGNKDNSNIQILLFTATLPSWVTSISNNYMKQKEKIIVDVVKEGQVTTASGIKHLAILCGFHQRSKVLADVLSLYGGAAGRCIVFTETKANANDIAVNSGISHSCQVLHGDIPQKLRENTLKAFKEGKFRYLVATDVAARGLHIDNIEVVVQLEPPKDVDTFVHRSGRTGRAGANGINIVFFRRMDSPFLATIEKTTGMKFQRVGVPQTTELIEGAAKKLADNISKPVDIPKQNFISKCQAIATTLISQLGPVEAVSRLLCELTGFSNGKEQLSIYSALSGNEGFKTYQIIFHTVKINTKNYVWQVLKNGLGLDATALNEFTSMTLRTDSTGAVFDVPAKLINEFDKQIEEANKVFRNSDSFAISPVSELPDLNDPSLASTSTAPSWDSKNPLARGGKRRRDDNKGGAYGGGNSNGKWQRTNSYQGRKF